MQRSPTDVIHIDGWGTSKIKMAVTLTGSLPEDFKFSSKYVESIAIFIIKNRK